MTDEARITGACGDRLHGKMAVGATVMIGHATRKARCSCRVH